MAIDTAKKRYSALGQRWGRLPFGRRFAVPLPDGTIDQADRQQLGFVYGGILTVPLAYGPLWVLAGAVWTPDSVRQIYVPGPWAGGVWSPDLIGQVYVSGSAAGQVYTAGTTGQVAPE